MTINLNYLNLLTIVFVVAKLWEKIDWDWFYVFLPTIIWLGFGALVWIFVFVMLKRSGH